MSSERQRENLVGGFLLLSLLALAGLVTVPIWARGMLDDTRRYTLVLDEGVGLAPGVDVTIAGLRVGSVESVRLTSDRQVALVLSVDSDYAQHVRVDSVGEASMTLSGKVVRIGPGTPEAPMLDDGGPLVSGHNFDVLRALEKMDLVHNLERMEAILSDLNALAKELRIGDGRIPEAMDAVMLLVADLQEGKGTVGRLLKDEATLNDLNQTIAALDQMATKVESAAVSLEGASGGVEGAGQAVVESAGHIGEASQALASTAKSVDLSAQRLADSLERLDAGLVELEKTMRAIQRIPFVKGGVKKEERDEADDAVSD